MKVLAPGTDGHQRALAASVYIKSARDFKGLFRAPRGPAPIWRGRKRKHNPGRAKCGRNRGRPSDPTRAHEVGRRCHGSGPRIAFARCASPWLVFGPAPAVAPLRSRALVRDELPHAREAPGRDLALRNRAHEVRARIGAVPALVFRQSSLRGGRVRLARRLRFPDAASRTWISGVMPRPSAAFSMFAMQ